MILTGDFSQIGSNQLLLLSKLIPIVAQLILGPQF